MPQNNVRAAGSASRQSSSLAFLTVLLVLIAGAEALYIYLVRWEKNQIVKETEKTEQDLNKRIAELYDAAQTHKKFIEVVGYQSTDAILALAKEVQPQTLRGLMDDLQLKANHARDELRLKMDHANLQIESFKSNLKTRDAELQQAKKELADAKQQLAELRKGASSDTTTLVDQVAKLNQQLADRTKELGEKNKQLAAKDQALLKKDKDIAAKDIEIAKLKSDWDKERDSWQGYVTYVDQLREQNVRLKQQLAIALGREPERVTGQITEVDLDAGFVYIDLGEGQAKPGMRFEVFESEADGKRGVRKGYIEVNNVHPSLSTATIIESDPKNPIKPGDIAMELLEEPSS